MKVYEKLALVFLMGAARGRTEALSGNSRRPDFNHPEDVTTMLDEAGTLEEVTRLRISFIDGVRCGVENAAIPDREELELHYKCETDS